MAIDAYVQKMLDGDVNEILIRLQSRSYVERTNAIVCAVKDDLRTKQSDSLLNCLKSDETYLNHRPIGPRICDFACAALHLLGLEPYQGTEDWVWKLIDIKMQIY